ncbi:hypothetical protein ACP70R_000878 [Stipagrostis hirtigluma subsp. patula]
MYRLQLAVHPPPRPRCFQRDRSHGGGGYCAGAIQPAASCAWRPFVICKPVTGSCGLRVDGYSHLSRLLGTGKGVDSSAFAAGGHSWSLQLFPNGESSRFKHDIGVALRLESDPGGDIDRPRRVRSTA